MYSTHHFTAILIVCIATSCIGDVLIEDYKSAFGPTRKYVGSQSLSCAGAYACSSMEFIKLQSPLTEYRDLWCEGSHSCSNTIILIGYNQFHDNIAYCWGYNACMGSTINYTSASNVNSYSSVSYLSCGGYRSCSHSFISGVSTVYGYASLSLYRAVIDTIGVIATTVNIHLMAPFAAYGAHLKCRANHICKIYCQSITACYNLYIDCMAPGGDNCEVTDLSPNIPNSYVPITNLSYFSTISYDFNISADFPLINTDILCLNEGSYDAWSQHYPNITLEISDKGPICCRGVTTCGPSIIRYETQKKTDLICSGLQACDGSDIRNINDTVFCEGHQSCYDSTIRHIDYVYCIGDSSCMDSDISGARHIKCDASWSCAWTTFKSNGVDLFLYLNGDESATGAYIYCDKTDVCTINCIGYESCLYTSVFCDTNAVNCIINCDIDIVGACPEVNGEIWNTALITTTSISATSNNTTSIDTTTIDTSSISTTSNDTTTIDTSSISTTSIDTTAIDTLSTNAALINTSSIISIQDDKNDDKRLIIIAVVMFLGGSCFIIATVVKILRLQKQVKEEEISMMNAVIAPKDDDDMKQNNNNALQEKHVQSDEVHKDENEVKIVFAVDEVDELQKQESLKITEEGFVDLKEWSHVEVAEWVKTVNNCMFAEYVQSFIDNEIDGNVLYDMTLQQLQLGLYMNNMVKRLQFYNLIQTLKHDKNINRMNNNNEKVIKPISVQKLHFEEDEDKAEELYDVNVEMQTTGNTSNTTIGEIKEIKLQRVLFKEWLSNKVKLPQYYNLLVKNGYESLNFIKQVTNEEELKDIGIYKKGHLLKLIKEIKRLQSILKEDNYDELQSVKKRNNINTKNRKTHVETVTNLTDGMRANLDLVDDIYAEEDKNQQNGQQQSILATTHKKEGTHYYDKYHHQKHQDNMNEVQ